MRKSARNWLRIKFGLGLLFKSERCANSLSVNGHRRNLVARRKSRSPSSSSEIFRKVPDRVQIDTTLNRQNPVQNHAITGRRSGLNRTAVDKHKSFQIDFMRSTQKRPICRSEAAWKLAVHPHFGGCYGRTNSPLEQPFECPRWRVIGTATTCQLIVWCPV